ncbi:BMP family ABC transporter substrate-binding protein [Colwellia sp. E2M01]|uniref:BMP family ABC transporter substrate-binding protein n=1 Tax=Colwellia sp. E2M01 TaxID=2841561 RepID=UPI001C0A4768|nr:BMP family ABC transporter substrate-binding protein [Colwellia sp. E2M01]MBU2870656.1 BMP family ABC transporter substrate-binding protein [Colwellia sp. E2M01]
MIKKIFIKSVICAGIISSALALTGCGDSKDDMSLVAAKSDSPDIAFLYIGTVGDEGWTYEHNRGRLYLEEKLGKKVDFVENVPENADAERIISQLAQDHDIIFATSFGHMDYILNSSKRFPKVKFLHAAGYKSSTNMGNYFGKNWEASYLTGIAAGSVSKTNKIGYLASFPIPQLVYNINAFTLGARSVNEDIEVNVIWNNSWYDPANERSAAISMADEGMDVLVSYPDSPATIKVAQERGIWGVGNSTSMAHYAPDAYITNPVWNWGVYYEKVVEEIKAGTWEGGSYLGGLKDGMVDLAEFGKNVPEPVKALVNKEKKRIISGEFNIFSGPIKDRDGLERVGSGEKISDEDVLTMNWFVEGVKGSLSN